MPVFEPTRGELDVILESKGRHGGVKLLINKGQRRAYRDLIKNWDPHERIM